jgi:diadenosine tetraphosphate (Ap4A) HIT family hydrolase
MNCELCVSSEEILLWRGLNCRVILVEDPDYPGFCRVIWNHHIKEMTDLAVDMRTELMHTVFATESAVREIMQPEKINLASLGNMTPHLHWHVIPRFTDDRHYPNPVWAAAIRNTRVSNQNNIQARLRTALLEKLGT